VKALIERVTGTRVTSLLDAGCGDGSSTRKIAEAVIGLKYLIGIDSDPAALEEAADGLQGLEHEVDVQLIRGDITAITLASDRFDAAVLCDVLHHLEQPQSAVAECFRLVRPGGWLFFSEMVADGLSAAETVGRDLHHLKASIDRLNGVPHGPTLPKSVLVSAVTAAGFEPVWIDLERRPVFLPADAQGKSYIEVCREYLEDYLRHAEDSSVYAGLRREAAFLVHRMETIGIAPAPSISLVATRPTQQTSGRPQVGREYSG
jgi:SAM-dependent methyltransferase